MTICTVRNIKYQFETLKSTQNLNYQFWFDLFTLKKTIFYSQREKHCTHKNKAETMCLQRKEKSIQNAIKKQQQTSH